MMATFSPPTYDFSAIEGAPPMHPGRRLFRRYTWSRGRSVLITNGVVSTYPGLISPTTEQIAAADAGSGDGGKAFFRGGVRYTITDAEATLLQAAGYETGA